MDGMIPVLAGAVSTVIFAGGTLPMLVKAARTKDLSSYSLGNIMLSNLGNVIHSIYVFHLPAGPMWVLHTFYLLSTALMLIWYLRYTPSPILGAGQDWGVRPTRHGPPAPSVLGTAVRPHQLGERAGKPGCSARLVLGLKESGGGARPAGAWPHRAGVSPDRSSRCSGCTGACCSWPSQGRLTAATVLARPCWSRWVRPV
jgi:hypothetical protein